MFRRKVYLIMNTKNQKKYLEQHPKPLLFIEISIRSLILKLNEKEMNNGNIINIRKGFE